MRTVRILGPEDAVGGTIYRAVPFKTLDTDDQMVCLVKEWYAADGSLVCERRKHMRFEEFTSLVTAVNEVQKDIEQGITT